MNNLISNISTEDIVILLLTTRLSNKDVLTTLSFNEFYKLCEILKKHKYEITDLLRVEILKDISNTYNINIDYNLLSMQRHAYCIEKIREWSKNNINIITCNNPHYPDILKKYKYSPTVLYVYGSIEHLNKKHVIIQGEDVANKQSKEQIELNNISSALGKFTRIDKPLAFYDLYSFINKNVLYGTNKSDRVTSTIFISSGFHEYLSKYQNYNFLIKKKRICLLSFWHPDKKSDIITKRYSSKIFNIFSIEKYLVHLSSDEDIKKLKLFQFLKNKNNTLYIRPGIFKSNVFKNLGAKFFVTT